MAKNICTLASLSEKRRENYEGGEEGGEMALGSCHSMLGDMADVEKRQQAANVRVMNLRTSAVFVQKAKGGVHQHGGKMRWRNARGDRLCAPLRCS
jgi:hypothetical protein